MSDRRTFLQAGLGLLGVVASGAPAFADRVVREVHEGRRRRRVYREERLSPEGLERQMRRTKDASRKFSEELHEAIDRGRLRHRRAEEADEEASKLHRQISQALREMERRESRDEIRGNVGRCIDAGRELDHVFEDRWLGRDLDEAWEELVERLNVLAAHYNFRGIYID